MDSDIWTPTIVLDPTNLYPPHPKYRVIQTEPEWLKFFESQTENLWIRGEKLHNWSEAWLKGRHQWNSLNVVIKQHPKPQLAKILHPEPIPEDWSDQDIFHLVNQLDRYDPQNPIPYFLADITNSDLSLWKGSPSLEHLAQWLSIVVPSQYRPLERTWQQQHSSHSLRNYYLTENKLDLLRSWLGITTTPLQDFNTFPLEIPNWIRDEFDNFWEDSFRRTDGQVFDTIPLHHQAGASRIIAQAYRFFLNRPQFYTPHRQRKLALYLNSAQKLALNQNIPPVQPLPLSIDATEIEALAWATNEYLPFRRWEIVHQKRSQKECSSTQLAQSFISWLLKKYSHMASTPVPRSYLNYSVGSMVFEVAKEQPILWVVVDGLGWLDHLDLLNKLKDYDLLLKEQIQPKFSILPTLTGYAKWSLYRQVLPNDTSWVEDAGQGFPETSLGKRYTDNMYGALLKDLRVGQQKLYCLDTVELDKLNHNAGDWQFLYDTQRPSTLRSIANKISALVNAFPNPEELTVVIASDHGQILGECDPVVIEDNDLVTKERFLEGEVDDPRFVVLRPEEFPVPKTISILLNAEVLSNGLKSQSCIGAHGGLFPDEVIVGISVLAKNIQRKQPLVICNGSGRPRENGELIISIDNPESLWMESLWLQINEIPELLSGVVIEERIAPHSKTVITIPIQYPELSNPSQNIQRISLSGSLTFCYANLEAAFAQIDNQSGIEVRELFTSGINIDDFL